MNIFDALLPIMLALPPPWDMSETRPAYEARVTTIAQAIDAEVREATDWKWRPEDLAAALIVITYQESRFRLSVHSGERRGDSGRSLCLAQVQSSRLVPRLQWQTLPGVDLDSTRACMRAAATVVTSAARRCAGRATTLTRAHMARIFGSYGSGKGCVTYKSAEERAGFWARVSAKLRSRPAESRYAQRNEQS